MRAVIIAMALARSQASRAESKSRPKTPKNRIRAVSGVLSLRLTPPRRRAPQDPRAEPARLTQTMKPPHPRKKRERPLYTHFVATTKNYKTTPWVVWVLVCINIWS